jgi:predicted DNA binding CopG/RHH family protein
MDPKYIDNEEKELMEAFENANNPESFKPSEEDQKKFKTAAKEFITSEKKMNIRIDPYELEKIKERGFREHLFPATCLDHQTLSGIFPPTTAGSGQLLPAKGH